MLARYLLLLLFYLSTLPGVGQYQYLQARLDVIWNMPQVEVLHNTGGYEIKGGKPLGGFKIGYSHFNQRNMGFSAGLQVAGKQYVIYEERRKFNTLVQSSTTPRSYSFTLPLAFEYRHHPVPDGVIPYYRKGFFSLSTGIALAYTKETSIRVRLRGSGSNFRGNLSHSDDFSFSSIWGYEIFLNPAYNFRFQDGTYVGMGVGFTLSPAKYALLSIKEQRDGRYYEGSFQPRLLNYLNLSVSYHLPVRKGSRKVISPGS
jgi:hypothetical protein